MAAGLQGYHSDPGRINEFKGKILAHAMHREVLQKSAEPFSMPKNSGNTVIYRRFVAYGAGTGTQTQNQPRALPGEHQSQEGVTPAVDTIQSVDIPVVLQQYGCMYGFTDVLADLHEDNIPEQMKIQLGERIGLVKEMLCYGTLKGAATRIFAGGTTRNTVDETINVRHIRQATRMLNNNRAERMTRILNASPNEGTVPIQGGWLAYCHTDLEHDLKQIDDFVEVSRYGSRNMGTVMKDELGSLDRTRFIESPELEPYDGAGSATGNNLKKTSRRHDVYPIILRAQKWWGNVMLRGRDSIKEAMIPVSQKDNADPLGQRGYCGATWYEAPFIQNDGWMVVIEVAVSEITN